MAGGREGKQGREGKKEGGKEGGRDLVELMREVFALDDEVHAAVAERLCYE